MAGVVRVAELLQRRSSAAKGDVWRLIWPGIGGSRWSSPCSSRHRGQADVRGGGRAHRRGASHDTRGPEIRTRLAGHDELAELGQALDRLAGSLATTLGELRAERDLQRRILEAMQEGVVVVDRDGRIVLVNPALRSMLLLGADAVGKLLIETVRHAELDDLVERRPRGSRRRRPDRDRAPRPQAAAPARARRAAVGRRRGAARSSSST